jgi:MFS family permease
MEDRRARAANTAIFFVTGATFAAWSTRIPAVQDRLGLTEGALAIAVLGLEGGAVLGLPAGAAVVARIGSRGALRLGFAVFPTALIAVALAPGLAALAFALGVMAAANSVVDVAMNAQGVELERRSRRPLLSGMHAGHSAGLIAGGVAGTAAAAAGLPVAGHYAAAAALGLIAGLVATRWLVLESAPRDGVAVGPSAPIFVRPSGPLVLLGLIAFCAFLLDGAAYTWSAVHVRSEHGAAPATAAAAFTLFAVALTAGRLAGDRLVARAGRTRIVQGCGLVAAAGTGVAIAASTPAAGLAGWALLGLGTSAIAPTVLGAAPATGGVPAPAAIAAVTTVGYLGSFTGPPLVGALAGATGLSAALGVLVVAGAACALLARPAFRPTRARTAA